MVLPRSDRGTPPADVSSGNVTWVSLARTSRDTAVNGVTTVPVAVAASLVGAVLLGFDGRYEPASDLDASSVKQIVY